MEVIDASPAHRRAAKRKQSYRPAHLRHSVQRIRKRISGAGLVVGLWGHEDMSDRERLPAIAPADWHVFSLREALRVCIAAASGSGDKTDAARDAKSGTAAS